MYKGTNALYLRSLHLGTSLVVQQLRLHAPNAGGPGWITSRGTKTLHAAQHSPKGKKKSVHFNYL